jgi:hypothetical protein
MTQVVAAGAIELLALPILLFVVNHVIGKRLDDFDRKRDDAREERAERERREVERREAERSIVLAIARSMLLESVYLSDARQTALAAIRAAQARAIAEEYGFDLPEDPSDFDAITEGLEEAALEGGFQDSDPVYEEQWGELQSLQDDLFGGVEVPSFDDDEPYWMQGAPAAEEDDSPKGFGAFIDDEEV